MAKAKGAVSSNKVTFGKRKKGKAQKSYNKHNHKERTYHGQGR
jgi:DNA-binding protein H-NS